MMAKAIPKAIGCLKIDDTRVPTTAAHTIPIYGMEDVQLSRDSNWQTETGPVSLTIAQWNGTAPLVYPFNFTLTAGVHCKTREQLLTWIRAAQAMVSHCDNGSGELAGKTSPPRVLLIIGDIVNTYGFVQQMSCNGKAPWSLGNYVSTSPSGGLPTQCNFSGSFMAAPGYEEGLIHVESSNRFLSAREVLARGYAVNR